MNRRDFILSTIVGAGLAGAAAACRKGKTVNGSIVGASSDVGHLLRDKDFSQPVETARHKVVIVGGGVSGLSAARWLNKNNVHDVALLDLEQHMGGNAASGRNDISSFPWGAHYVPIPNNDLGEYLDFLHEHGVITGFDAPGLPVYNDYYLCFDPEERLYINGRWQDGLVPHYGLPKEDAAQVQKFLDQMEQLRRAKGTDGRDAFAIPINNSSKDEIFTRLDAITMKDWLLQNDYCSGYLHWYVNYCTKDDFGTPHHLVSAWAGIHYFAGRKGKGVNAEYQDVLTWPEGNGFLVEKLQKQSGLKKYNGCLAVKASQQDGKVQVIYLDVAANKVKQVEADHCILCTPQFVSARLLSDEARLTTVHRHLQYVPWMVANLTVDKLQERSGAPLSWDNVVYESESLGYVDATHQFLQQRVTRRNLTYYLPLTGNTPSEERKRAAGLSHAEWTEIIFNDLKKIHPDIRSATREINIMLWGHAMVQPLPGVIHGPTRQQLSQSAGNIHFAHTDLAGISIFEEAFYQGIGAAKKVLSSLTS